MIFGTQLCKWILIILVNLLRCMPCTSLSPGDVMLMSLKSCRSPSRDTVTMLQRERESCQEFIAPEMWPSNSPGLNLVDYSIWGILQERVYRSQIQDVKELKERLMSEWSGGCWTTPSSWQWLHSGVVVWRHVFAWMVDILNINFEPLTFYCVFNCFVCFVDTGCPKCDWYIHVQSANIVWNLLPLCLRLLHGMVAT